MIYVSCSQGYNKCTWNKIPMISDVIRDPMFDRVFLLLNTGYFIGIHQVNVRSLYSRFRGIISMKKNNILLIAGLISSFSLPLIGVFDNRNHQPIHYLCAATFFISSAYYLSMKAYLMHKHKDELLDQLHFSDPHSEVESMHKWNARIVFNYHYSHVCTLVVLALFIDIGIFGSGLGITSILEWSCVFLYMTLTMLIMSALPCYDQISLSPHIANLSMH